MSNTKCWTSTRPGTFQDGSPEGGQESYRLPPKKRRQWVFLSLSQDTSSQTCALLYTTFVIPCQIKRLNSTITREQRSALAPLLRAGMSQADCARILGVLPGTVSREIQRNSRDDGVYDAAAAQRKSRARRRSSKKQSLLLENNPALAQVCNVQH